MRLLWPQASIAGPLRVTSRHIPSLDSTYAFTLSLLLLVYYPNHNRYPTMPPKRTTKRTKASPPSPGTTSEMNSQRLLEDEEMPEEDMQHIPATSPVDSSSSGGGYGYNAIKTHQGQIYSGMAVGGSHTWDYDPGVWKETKEEPDLWRIDYQTNKRRAKRKAPAGSGAPVGTEYHWLIVGHQVFLSCLQYLLSNSDAHVPPYYTDGQENRRKHLRNTPDRIQVQTSL